MPLLLEEDPDELELELVLLELPLEEELDELPPELELAPDEELDEELLLEDDVDDTHIMLLLEHIPLSSQQFGTPFIQVGVFIASFPIQTGTKP